MHFWKFSKCLKTSIQNVYTIKNNQKWSFWASFSVFEIQIHASNASKACELAVKLWGFVRHAVKKCNFLQIFKMFQNFPKWVLELFCVRFGNKWCATLSSVVSQGDPERASCRVKIVISTAVLPTSGHNSESKNPRRRRVLRTHPRRFSSGRSKFLNLNAI